MVNVLDQEAGSNDPLEMKAGSTGPMVQMHQIRIFYSPCVYTLSEDCSLFQV